MKIKRGLPSKLVFVRPELQPLVKKLQWLSQEDLNELETFMDYLLKFPDQHSEGEKRSKLSRLSQFMDGGLPKNSNHD